MGLDLTRSIVVEIDGTGAVVGARKVKDALNDIDRATDAASKSIGGIEKSSASAASSAALLSRSIHGALAAMSVGAIAGFAKEIMNAGIAADSLRRSFVAIGGQGGSVEMLSFLRTESERLGQSFYDLAPAFKGIAAASRGTTLEGESTRKIFSAITEASTALGLSSEETSGALNAISQMMSKGNVQAEELRGQLGERLPGAFKLMADAMGVSQSKLNDMLDKGEVLATDALPKLADAIHKMYGEAAQTAALESGQAAVNRLSQEWTDLKTNLYDSGAAVSGINAITSALRAMNDVIKGADDAEKASVKIKMLESNVRLAKEEIQTTKDGSSQWKALNSEISDGEKKIALYRGQLEALKNPGIDMFLAFQKGKDAADQRSSSASAGSEKVAKYLQTERDKVIALRDEMLKLATTEDERVRINARAKQQLDSISSTAAKRGLSADNSTERAREKALKDAMERNALQPYQATQLGQMNQGDMFYGLEAANKRALEMMNDQTRENLQLQTEFADKYRETVLGETAFKIEQLELQGEAYKRSGADEVAVAQWVNAEKKKLATDWQSGAMRALEEYANSSKNAAQSAEDAVTNSFKSMEDAIVEFATTGKLSFSDFANSVISDMVRMIAQQSITGPLASGMASIISGMFSGGSSVGVSSGKDFWIPSAKGNVFSATGLHAYANSIVSSPTVFPFARGAGLMGEAGPEAIMPLKRGANGVLGVQGGGSNVIVNVYESKGNGGQINQRQEGGATIIDIFVEQVKDSISSDIARGSGNIPAALSQTYGLNRSAGAY